MPMTAALRVRKSMAQTLTRRQGGGWGQFPQTRGWTAPRSCTLLHCFVYTISVKSITFSADENAIEQARQMARLKKTTLNEEFRKWLAQYGDRQQLVERYEEVMKKLSYVDMGGRKFTRDEMNERR